MAHTFDITIPADIPTSAEQDFVKHYAAITKKTGRLMMFSCDQKIEHLNKDFYGPNIAPDAQSPEHFFMIASRGTIGAFATHLGLISRYGRRYPNLNYIVKLNGKTDLIPSQQRDPISNQLWSVYDVITFKKSSGINICGVGFTIYLGSEYEEEMLAQAAEMVYEAHQYGLIAILWIYPRGKNITDEHSPELVAGAAGLGVSLGADFVKLKPPAALADLARAVTAAGNTKIICSGGAAKAPELFLQELHDQLHTGKVAGSATGRNIFQKSLPEAVAFTKAISSIVYDNLGVQEAVKLYQAIR